MPGTLGPQPATVRLNDWDYAKINTQNRILHRLGHHPQIHWSFNHGDLEDTVEVDLSGIGV